MFLFFSCCLWKKSWIVTFLFCCLVSFTILSFFVSSLLFVQQTFWRYYTYFCLPVLFLETISSIKKGPKSNNIRNRIEIMAKILIETKTDLNKIRIIYKLNLSYQQLQLYLKFLLQKKLLVRKVDKKGREKFVTTTKGNNFVKNFHLLHV